MAQAEKSGLAIVFECPHCGSPFQRQKRLGVWLPPLKARIFDIIKRAGWDGIEKETLRDMLDMSPSCLKSHIWQINDLFEDTGLRLDGRWRVRLRCSKEAAK